MKGSLHFTFLSPNIHLQNLQTVISTHFLKEFRENLIKYLSIFPQMKGCSCW